MSNVVRIGQPLPIGEWEVDGWRIKTEQGFKGAQDRKVWVASPNGDYQLLTLAGLGAIARCWFLNEEILYPEERHEGGWMVLRFLGRCMEAGVEAAAAEFGLKQPRIIRKDAA